MNKTETVASCCGADVSLSDRELDLASGGVADSEKVGLVVNWAERGFAVNWAASCSNNLRPVAVPTDQTS
jgi:hypothetical protein